MASSVQLSRSARFLLVDSDEIWTESLAERLKVLHPGWEIECATTASAAVQILLSAPIDVLVTELALPDMSGERLLRAVAERHPLIGRVVLAARANAGALEHGRLAHRVLTKPSDDAALVSALSVVLELRRERQIAATAAAKRRTAG